MEDDTSAAARRAALFETVKHALVTAPDSVALASLVRQSPFMIEPDFLSAVGRWADEAEGEGGLDMAEGLRERLAALRELAAQENTALREALEAFAAARSDGDLDALIRDAPFVAEGWFADFIEELIARAEEAGDDADAAALRLRLEGLRRLLRPGGDLDDEPAAAQALMALLSQDVAATRAALEADPQRLEEAFHDALEALSNARGMGDLVALLAQAPFALEDRFIARAEAGIAAAQQLGQEDRAARLRTRLDGLRQLKTQIEVTLPHTLQAFAGVRDGAELLSLTQRVPFVRGDGFMALVARTIAELTESGQSAEAAALSARLDALRQIREQSEMADRSPVMQALIAFLNAHTGDEARAIFAEQRALLDSDEAQRTLEEVFSGGDPESQQRIEERAALLRSLRG